MYIAWRHLSAPAIDSCTFLSTPHIVRGAPIAPHVWSSLLIPPRPPLVMKEFVTGADAAMTSAVAEFMPNTVHLHCLWYIMKNSGKNCQAALSQKANRFSRLLKAATIATSEHVSDFIRFHKHYGLSADFHLVLKFQNSKRSE